MPMAISGKAARKRAGRRPGLWLVAGCLLAEAILGGLAISAAVWPTTADAQYFRDDRYPQARRPQRPGGFFERLFGGGRGGDAPPEIDRFSRGEPSRGSGDSSRAPPPKKYDTPPTITVTVMGDAMADWLAYGLEDVFADSPEIAIQRKTKPLSGLLRYDARSDLDWWHVARDQLAQDKTDFVVMMLGTSDRTDISESQLQKAADKAAKEQKDKAAKDQAAKDQAAKDQATKDQAGAKAATPPGNANKDAAGPDAEGGAAPQTAEAGKKADDEDDDDDEQPSIAAPERSARGSVEFHSERWESIYTKRIDDTIAALKSRGVPVIWVGLPPIKGTRSTANASYLNELFRARAEKAGIAYVDVWDGFVDDGGKFTTHGPDFEGQIRRLRSGDGVNFTKSGARKLAHYVERELRRFMNNRALPLALPSGGGVVPDSQRGPAERPLAGPVVPLAALNGGASELLGGGATRPVHTDPTATRVLVKGETVVAPPRRADNYAWPRSGEAPVGVALPPPPAAKAPEVPAQGAAPQVAAPPQAALTPPSTAPTPDPASAGANSAAPEVNPQKPAARPAKPTARAAQPQQGQPRPPDQIPQQRKPQAQGQQQPRFLSPSGFGWLR